MSSDDGIGIWFHMYQPADARIYRRYFKRPLDLVFSLGAIIALSPIMLMVAILARVNLGSPTIYKQQRPGLNERIFTLYKFRTMTEEKDGSGQLLPDSIRLNRFGRILRSTSMDELPELFNILKGDMSVVGPRPLLVRYLPYYTQGEKQRHSVRPGLTGLAQVSGRNNLEWDSRLAMDVEYVGRISFLLDLEVVFKTLVKVARREGVKVADEATFEDLDFERRRFFDSQGTAV